ncbi:hypothetical protein [Streptomyces sp. 900116325]
MCSPSRSLHSSAPSATCCPTRAPPINSIAELFGVSPGTLCNHIPDLRELRAGTVLRQLEAPMEWTHFSKINLSGIFSTPLTPAAAHHQADSGQRTPSNPAHNVHATRWPDEIRSPESLGPKHADLDQGEIDRAVGLTEAKAVDGRGPLPPGGVGIVRHQCGVGSRAQERAAASRVKAAMMTATRM